MSAIFLLIGVSLLVALGFLAAYIWAVRGGQYDDVVTPSMRMLMEDPAGKETTRGSSAAAERDGGNSDAKQS